MERVTFDNLRNWWLVLLMVFALICIAIGFFRPFDFHYPQIYKRISAFGFLLQAICLSRMFWFKNYVQWNKKGMMLKIGGWFNMGTSIRFDEVKSINFTESQIEFTLFGGRKKRVVDIHKIDAQDKQTLAQLLEKHIDKNKLNFFVTLAN